MLITYGILLRHFVIRPMLHTRFYLAAVRAKGMKIKRAEDNSMNILRRRGKIAFKNSARFVKDPFLERKLPH